MLITDGNCSLVTYLYADRRIQWTTGDASGGEGGLGSTPAQAGFDAGVQTRYFSIPGSRTPAIVNIELTSNIGIPGQWTFTEYIWKILLNHASFGSIKEPYKLALLPTGERLFMYMCGSDPHFAIHLLEGELLCYIFQSPRAQHHLQPAGQRQPSDQCSLCS